MRTVTRRTFVGSALAGGAALVAPSLVRAARRPAARAAGIEAARRAGMHSIGAGAAGLEAADVVVASLVDLPADAFERLVPPE